MRQVFVINEIFPERTIDTTKTNGQSDKMSVIGLEIECAGATIFAEMFGKVADKFKAADCDKGTVLTANLDFEARSWGRSDGGTGHGTNIKIIDFTIIKREEKGF